MVLVLAVPLCVSLVLIGLALLSSAQAASADAEFCPPGSGAGQCAPAEFGSRGLVLDREAGILYQADNANNRTNAFDEEGQFLFAFGWG